jgi:hypothetical protein
MIQGSIVFRGWDCWDQDTLQLLRQLSVAIEDFATSENSRDPDMVRT